MRTIIITGANSGLGFETAKKIANNKDYEVILACRNIDKGNNTKEEIIKETNNQNITVLELDISSLESVRNFVQEFKKLNKKVYGLVNNAGISSLGHEGNSVDGIEIVCATNYLGHFLLTNLLLPYMEDNAKIFNVTSDMHNPPGGIEWRDPETLFHPLENDRKKYSYSKLCNIYFTYELDEILRKNNSNILVNAFNPGMMNTNFSGGHNSKARTAMVKLTMPDRLGDLDKSSSSLAKLLVNDEYKDSGKYYDRSTNYINSSELSYNVENRKDLWDKSISITGLEKGNTK